MHVVAYSEMGSNIEYIFWRKRVALIDYTRSALFRIAPGKQWRRFNTFDCGKNSQSCIICLS